MAAKSVPLAIPGGGAGADIVSGRSPMSRPAPGLASSGSAGAGMLDDTDRAGRSIRGPSAPPNTGKAGGGSRAASSSASQAAQISGDRSSGSTGSDSSTESAGNGRSAKAGNSSAGTGSSKQSADSATQGRGASGASSAGAAQTAAQGSTHAAAGANDFAAALAQSLAATPADGAAATTDTAAIKSQGAAAGESSDPHAKHSAADPVSSALALLEQALAGGLVAAQSTPAVASTPGTSTSGPSSPAGGTIDTAGKGGAAALTALLAQNLPTDTRAGGSNSASASGTAASAASGASAATAAMASTAAALTAAAQLSSGSQIASQHGPDSSRLALASPVGTSAWTDELGTKLTWMAHQGMESASLQLSPEHLGPLQVSISVHNGQASVWFGAAQPDTRTALQQSLPQLRHLFASQGLTLADAGVSREPPRGQSRQNSPRSTAPVSAAASVNLESSGTRTALIAGLGLLDTYV